MLFGPLAAHNSLCLINDYVCAVWTGSAVLATDFEPLKWPSIIGAPEVVATLLSCLKFCEQSVENQGKQTSKNAKNQTDMLQDPQLIG